MSPYALILVSQEEVGVEFIGRDWATLVLYKIRVGSRTLTSEALDLRFQSSAQDDHFELLFDRVMARMLGAGNSRLKLSSPFCGVDGGFDVCDGLR